MSIDIVTASIEDVLPVRIAAFAPLGVSPGGRSPQDELPDTVHAAIRIDDQLVCVSTLSRDPSPRSDHQPVWRIQGMATLPNHQGHGYGGTLIQHYVDHIAEAGGGLLWGHLRLAAIPFYERHGFVVQEDVYVTRSGVSHRYGDRLIAAA